MNRNGLFSLLLVLGLPLFLRAPAGEYEIHTADGQTLQGEYLGMEDGVVKLKTKFGVLQINSKDVVTMTAAPPKAAPAEQPAGDQPAAEKPAPEKEAAPPPPPAKAAKPEAKESAKAEPPEKPAAPPRTFPEPKMPDPVALATTSAALAPPPEPSKQEYLQMDRAVSNFADTNTGSRKRSVRMLQSFGRMAEPFIEGAYNNPAELNVRVDLLEALAVPGRALTTPIFAKAHAQALAALSQAGSGPPPAPDPFAKGDRPMTRSELMQLALSNVLDLEGYMSTAGGPYNTLFLLDTYRKRYSSDKTETLLLGLARDRARLAAAAADAGRSRSAWDTEDRIRVIELALPMLFKDNRDLQALSQALLTKLLPASHPKWTADEEDWVDWWEKARDKIK